MGVHESIIPGTVTPMVQQQHRAAAFSSFTAGSGIFWFLGGARSTFHTITRSHGPLPSAW
jgi:hypothetical protein